MSLDNSNHRVALRVDNYYETQLIESLNIELEGSGTSLVKIEKGSEVNKALVVRPIDYHIAKCNLEIPNQLVLRKSTKSIRANQTPTPLHLVGVSQLGGKVQTPQNTHLG